MGFRNERPSNIIREFLKDMRWEINDEKAVGKFHAAKERNHRGSIGVKL